MNKIILLADFHLLAGAQLFYGLDPQLRLRQCLQEINSYHRDADLLIALGDNSDDGSSDSYRVLKSAFADLAIPQYFVMGNHDNRANFVPLFGQDPSYKALEWAGYQLIILDSQVANKPYGHLDKQQLDWLAKQLANSDNQALVFIHHPMLNIGHSGIDGIKLNNSDDFLAVLQKHRAKIAQIFFAHIHRSISGLWHGMAFSSVNALVHNTYKISPQNLFAAPHSLPSYTVVCCDKNTLLLQQHFISN